MSLVAHRSFIQCRTLVVEEDAPTKFSRLPRITNLATGNRGLKVGNIEASNVIFQCRELVDIVWVAGLGTLEDRLSR